MLMQRESRQGQHIPPKKKNPVATFAWGILWDLILMGADIENNSILCDLFLMVADMHETQGVEYAV